MKPKVIIFLIFAFLIVLMFLLSRRREQNRTHLSEVPIEHATSNSLPAVGPFQSNLAAAVRTKSISGSNTGRLALSNVAHRGMEEYLRANVGPIEFYGIVMDEAMLPIADADIHFSETTPPAATKKSGADGRFSLAGVSGRYLDVKVSKPGYYASKSNRSWFDFSPTFGSPNETRDPSRPVIFQLRKKGPGADLITSQYGVFPELEFSMPGDGSPVRVDFLTRKVGNSGHLQLSSLKPPPEQAPAATEWSFRLSIPDGGLVEHRDEFPFEAPESGYKPTVEFQFKRGETNWVELLRKEFYIVFGQPRKYGRLKLQTGIDRGVYVGYAINPDGSRYLEPKEKQPQRRQLPPGVVEIIPKQTE